MTEYFEVHSHDAAARLGELRLVTPVETPAVIGAVDAPPSESRTGVASIVDDAGSRWPTERTAPDGSNDRLTILPHRAFPSGTDERIQEAFAAANDSLDAPSAAVISPRTASDQGTDAYVLAGATGRVGHASAFVDAIIETREAIPPDTALYLPGVATPRNLATVVYGGVDLVDADLAVVRGTQGRYLTSTDEYDIEDLDELPCACEVCTQGVATFDREDCVEHNVRTLLAELRTIRRRIREGRLRDYLEAQARHNQWLLATIREFDQQWDYLETRTPVFRQAEITAASEDTLRRAEIRRFADRVTSRYTYRFDAPLVLVPCSARKPYSESQSHGQFHDAIRWRGHVVSMTSPIGVVPQELELTYPAQHYDSVVTGRWSAEEIAFVSEVLSRYLDRADYPRIIAHIPPDGYSEIVDRAVEDRAIPITYTVEDHPTTDESLANLADALDGESQYRKRKREHNTVKAIADYQFGEGAGDRLFRDIETKARYPKLRVIHNQEQLAAMVPSYGLLALTIAGGRQWIDSDIETRRVEIDDFVPHGSVLAPGVTAASSDIRVGDEVVIEGPEAFGVGRARMSGPEMNASTRGVAVHVRHIEEL